MDAERKYSDDLAEMSWYDYVNGASQLGVAGPDYENLTWTLGDEKETSKVYKLYMVRLARPSYELSQDARSSVFEKLNAAFTKAGGRRMLSGKLWTTEEWTRFGLEEFPNADAAQEYNLAEQEMGFLQYLVGFVLLGTPMPKYSGLEW